MTSLAIRFVIDWGPSGSGDASGFALTLRIPFTFTMPAGTGDHTTEHAVDDCLLRESEYVSAEPRQDTMEEPGRSSCGRAALPSPFDFNR